MIDCLIFAMSVIAGYAGMYIIMEIVKTTRRKQ